MSQLLTLSRAAQLLGVSRHALQKQIRDGELASQDGMIASKELQRAYPDLRIEDSGVFEKVSPASRGFVKSARERILPTKEILAQRLFGQGNELADARRHLAHYRDLIEVLREKVSTLVRENPSAGLKDIEKTINDGLAALVGDHESIDRVAAMNEVLRVVEAHVRVRPSGHEFFVEGSESILDAALHAGLAPSYGCGNGNCGLCKARVVEGEVRQVRDFDYPLSEAERAQNYKLLCSHTAVTDLVLEMIEAETPADIPEQQVVARVKNVSSLDERTFLLHLESPRTNRLRFLSGQRVTLGIYSNRADCRGNYAIASCPCDDRNLSFHISRAQAEAGDEFAACLFAGGVHAGDSVNVRGPFGDFVLDQKSPRPIAFVCCDLGFAPVKSLVEHALAIDSFPAITVCWAATRPGGQYLANQCRAWADALDDFRYVPLDAPDDAAAGRAAVAALADDVPGVADRDVYVAGNEAFVSAATAALQAAGVPKERIAAMEL
ncbi:MAG: 2Fe-2S iron-sulfur cluster binding domain-containing protein [Gammaproteobacteria bacterium]|nr:2Fe-2S iron-sulfur cluster binding domain-containing protein [Gammaproteobacteria bacterium]MBU1414642.1 2Fe-2S iron-sulfur cluster binding domain-containing protein [Gammaproteobacteria bacterium]